MSATTTRVDTSHAGLSRRDVVARALEFVEANGADALSMRKLAHELGVTTNTIYWHVGSSNELHIAIIEMLADQQGESVIVGTSCEDRVVSAAMNIWTNALEHRNVTALARQIGATTLLELPLEVAVLSELEAGGVSGAAARDALRSILCCVAGFLIAAWGSGVAVKSEIEPERLWQAVPNDQVSAKTKRALRKDPDLAALLERTLRSIVAPCL